MELSWKYVYFYTIKCVDQTDTSVGLVNKKVLLSLSKKSTLFFKWFI
jgi:hypothetical protein